MPWPEVGHEGERELVEALRGKAPGAPAALYDAYADRLNDYAVTLLRDRDAAARVVRDVIVATCGDPARLPAPDGLRAWLYARTRARCAARGTATALARAWRRARTRARTEAVDLDDPEDLDALDPLDDPDALDGNAPGLGETRAGGPGGPVPPALVRGALARLGRAERESLDLMVRHGLSTAEAGTVLGLSAQRVTALLEGARARAEDAAAAPILATWRHCPALPAIAAGPARRRLARRAAKRVTEHIAACAACAEHRRRHLTAERLLGSLPIAYAPLSLRRHVVDGPHGTGERGADQRGQGYRGERRRGRGRPARSPEPRGGSAPRRRRPVTQRILLLVGAAASMIGAGAAGVVLAALILGGAGGPGTGAPGTDALGGPGTSGPGDGRGRALAPSASPVVRSPSPSPDAGPSGRRAGEPSAAGPPDAGPAATTAPANTAAYQRSPLPRRTRTRARPKRPRLAVDCPRTLGAAGRARITLTAVNAVVEWRATAPDGLIVRPAHGVLKAGAHGRLTVLIGPEGTGNGTGVIMFSSTAGGASCAITSAATPEASGRRLTRGGRTR